MPPEEVESLLSRLAGLAKAPGHVIDLYERQVTRCKSPQDRLRALARAAQVAAEHDALDRARQFFDISLGGGVQEETLTVLEDIARLADVGRDGKVISIEARGRGLHRELEKLFGPAEAAEAEAGE